MKLSGGFKINKYFLIVFKELLKGKSLPRIFLNINLKEIKLSGKVLDLGSKSSKGSYNRFLQKENDCNVIYTDFFRESDGVIKLNLEEKFLIDGGSYDQITCFNTLEHIYDYKNLISESFRILKNGGVFIGQTPFLVNYHADPNDYFRYTHQSIEKIFEKEGFVCEKMIFLGYGPLTASLSMSLHIFPKILRPFIYLFILFFDFLILKLKKSQNLRYPLGYLFKMRKK